MSMLDWGWTLRCGDLPLDFAFCLGLPSALLPAPALNLGKTCLGVDPALSASRGGLFRYCGLLFAAAAIGSLFLSYRAL